MPRISANSVAATIEAAKPNGAGQPSLRVVIAKAYPPTAIKPAWPKLSSPVKPKCTTSPIVARAYAAVVGEMASPRASHTKFRFIFSSRSAHAFLPAQDALGPEEQDEDQDHEGRRVLEVLGQHERRQGHEHAEDDRAARGAKRGPEPAESDRREDQQQDRAAGVPAQRLVVGDQHA